MYIANVTNDYDKITSSINTGYENITSNSCTNSGNNIKIVIPLIAIIPCGMSLVCLISLTAYTLVKYLFNKK